MSAHAYGGLVDVELWVRSVTSEGIIILIMNSPNLLASLGEDAIVLLDDEVTLKAKMSDHNFFFNLEVIKLQNHLASLPRSTIASHMENWCHFGSNLNHTIIIR